STGVDAIMEGQDKTVDQKSVYKGPKDGGKGRAKKPKEAKRRGKKGKGKHTSKKPATKSKNKRKDKQ
ncbi:MAG: hypothetical protein GY753_08445, partial [Gammaproteobacteria bacterium]|nr:hypothetical protein [Gammaproteobacteria bacterium]